MKIVASCVLLLCMSGASPLFTACLNNAEGKQHVKLIGKKKKRTYTCLLKSKAYYASRRGGDKLANRFYDKNDACKTCGCPSSEHDDGVTVAPQTPQ